MLPFQIKLAVIHGYTARNTSRFLSKNPIITLKFLWEVAFHIKIGQYMVQQVKQ